jgi:hypothetical protein
VEGAVFPNFVPVPDEHLTFDTGLESEVLRIGSNNCAVANEIVGAHDHVAGDHGVGLDDAAWSDDGRSLDDCVGPDNGVRSDLGIRMDAGGRVDAHDEEPSTKQEDWPEDESEIWGLKRRRERSE